LEEGLKLKVGEEMQRRVFDRFGMTRTGMTWRETFATNYADGYSLDGKIEPHHHRTNVRAAGSMDTSVADFARFFSGFLRGDGLSTASRAEMLRPQIAITSAHQFPTLMTNTAPAYRKTELASGLGVVLFQSRYGPAFWKGGHDEWTANLVVGVPGQKRGIVLLSNSTRAETIYPLLVESLLGDLGLPWPWEYNPEPAP
jgi:CubicO group peptidase (beta-lactamase class C family)